MSKRELLIGCGSNRDKKMHAPGDPNWHNLTTLDMDERHKPDIVWNLDYTPWRTGPGRRIPTTGGTITHRASPIEESSFDEVHAYEVLEHFGAQGDFEAFFRHFAEIYRILKPGGLLFASCPAPASPWAWGDPGHTRVVSPEALTFLDQEQYTLQVGKTAMSDYRTWWKGDLVPRTSIIRDGTHYFVLEAIKPSRIKPAT